jgi:pimeloyl-ACP methyl ester carboxylesterase
VAEGIAPVCADAVIVIPGIMGSQLVDAGDGTVLWGLSARSYASFWTGSSPWEKLKVTEEERSGRMGRVKATGLLTASAFAPLLRGIEPYTRLTEAVRGTVLHRDAVLEYPYDWRLSVAHNARILATAAARHLETWRRHPRGSRSAKLVLVAHSMGGLIARFLTGVLGADGEVRQSITIGTPFQGAVKAVVLLDRGAGGPVPLPRRRLTALARTLPGIYDLLPSYRCVEHQGTARRLTPADVRGLGGDEDLARDSARMQEAIGRIQEPDLRTVVGVEQPTMQSLQLWQGVARPQYYTLEDDGNIDWRGDGTVYSQVAAGGVEPVSNLPQSHGALARSSEAIAAVRALLTRRRLGPPMGTGGVGLEVPESIAVGEPFEITVTSQDDAGNARCRIVDADTDLPLARPLLLHKAEAMVAQARLTRAGLYRVEVKNGGFSAVSQLVMVVSDAEDAHGPAELSHSLRGRGDTD